VYVDHSPYVRTVQSDAVYPVFVYLYSTLVRVLLLVLVPVVVPDSVPHVPHEREVDDVEEQLPSVQLVSVSTALRVSYTHGTDEVAACPYGPHSAALYALALRR
jgi:hypothetical protein